MFLWLDGVLARAVSIRDISVLFYLLMEKKSTYFMFTKIFLAGGPWGGFWGWDFYFWDYFYFGFGGTQKST